MADNVPTYIPNTESFMPKKIYGSTEKKVDAVNKVYGIEKNALYTTGRALSRPIMQAGDTGKGLQTTMDVVAPMGIIATGSMRSMGNFFLKESMHKELDIHSKYDFKESLKDINNVLVRNNISPINEKLRGQQLRQASIDIANSFRTQGLGKSSLTSLRCPFDVTLALVRAEKMGVYSSFSQKKSLRKLRIRGTRVLTRTLKKNDAGKGMAFSITVAKRSKIVTKAGIKTTRSVARVGRFAAQKAIYASTLAALKFARATKLNQIQVAKKTKDGVVKVTKVTKNVTHAVTKRPKSFFKKGREFIKDPFKIKKRINTLRRKAVKRIRAKLANKFGDKLIGKAVNVFFNVGSKIASSLANFFAVIGSVLKTILVSLLVILILTWIICAIISAVVNLFNFAASEQEIRDAVVKKVQECYTDDMNYIAGLQNKYSNIVVEYEDIKDQDWYNQDAKKNKKDDKRKHFTQTTNCAEIFSMALVRYGYDFEKAGEDEVLNYVEQLYHGSHEISVQEKGDDSKKNAVVVYRTYYFTDIFDCQLSSSSLSGEYDSDAGEVISQDSIENDIYVACRKKGFTHAATCATLANIKCESGFNPMSTTGKYYGLCQWGDGRLENLKNYSSDEKLDYKMSSAQISFMFYEMNKSYNKLYSYLTKKNCNDVNMATQEFCAVYEGCIGSTKSGEDAVYEGTLLSSKKGTTYQLLGRRIKEAEAYAQRYDKYKDNYKELESSIGTKVANLGLNYIGKLHYYWGGTSLTDGADCSGFVYALYLKYGVIIPRGSASILGDKSHKILDKIDYSKMKPGDVIVESSSASGSGMHVTMYVGNQKIIGSNGNMKGCFDKNYKGAGGSTQKANGRECPNDCGYTNVGNVLGVYRYVNDKKGDKKDNKKDDNKKKNKN